MLESVRHGPIERVDLGHEVGESCSGRRCRSPQPSGRQASSASSASATDVAVCTSAPRCCRMIRSTSGRRDPDREPGLARHRAARSEPVVDGKRGPSSSRCSGNRAVKTGRGRLLLAQIHHSCNSTRSRTSDRPRPALPRSSSSRIFLREGSKMRGRNCGGDARPVVRNGQLCGVERCFELQVDQAAAGVN